MIIILRKENLEETSKILKVLELEDKVSLGWISDETKTSEGINFKINYSGNSVPIWLKGVFEEEKLNSALAGISAALSLGLNIVEISDKLKNK